VIKMANMAQLVNVIAPIFTDKNRMFLQTIYHPLSLYANNAKGKALDIYLDSPKYTSKRFGDVRHLDTSAAYDNGTLVLNVVNRHKDQAIETEFETQDKAFAGPVEISEVNGPDIKSENSFDTTTVKTTTRSARADGKKFRYSFPAHSYTMLKAKLV
jgi:alpha-N-arabinofuranosidase